MVTNKSAKGNGQAVALMELVPGDQVIVRSIDGGHGCRQRLAAMGILPGADMSIVKGGRGGPVVVEVIGSRFLIGRGMAHRVMVELKS